jgi:hypothetical protein
MARFGGLFSWLRKRLESQSPRIESLRVAWRWALGVWRGWLVCWKLTTHHEP